MLKVLFDHQKFDIQRYGGITRYFSILMQAIKDNPYYSYQLGSLYTTNYYIKDEPLPLNNFIGRALFEDNAYRKNRWNKQYSKLLLKANNFDLLHPTYFHPYFLKYTKKPYVLTMHDMIYEALPGYFPADEPTAWQKKLTAERADGIIAISESTRKDLINFLNVSPEKITMIHHGLDLDKPLLIEPIPNLPKDFILFVGDRATYKNFPRFIEAAAEVLHEFKDLHIVFAGGGEFKTDDTATIEQLKIADRCTQISATDGQLNYLYQQAQLFVFPSLYEGFGYPLLEAFKAGCPIAASNTSCFPEIGGDAIAYFDPHETGNMYDVIKSVLTDTNKHGNLIAKGNERLKLFPIKKQTDATLAFYSKIVG